MTTEKRSEAVQASEWSVCYKCPACGSENIEGDMPDVGATGASQDCWCNDCSATWTLVFKLAGYEFLEVSNAEGN